MDIERIISLLENSTATIQAAGSFSARLNVVYDILDQAFPKTSAAAAIYGPITDLTGFISRTGIDSLLQVIKKSADSSHEFKTTDAELNIVLKNIYDLVKE